ncbi:MAG: triose-phosphate isomerase [Devosia sp.]
MAQNITPLIAGNWKMNGLRASLLEIEKLTGKLAVGPAPRCTVAICPPATLIAMINRAAAPGGVVLGAQDCHPAASGAHTGDLSAAMLADAGAHYVIVGHSERRADHGETDDLVRQKTLAALSAGLVPIICVGETRAQREAGEADSVVAKQLAASVPDQAAGSGFVVAYEPVWAIGTGLTPTSADIEAMHKSLRRQLISRFGTIGEGVRLLYGGSLKPSNAAEILAIPEVNGGLVGGASLLADEFHAIISAA